MAGMEYLSSKKCVQIEIRKQGHLTHNSEPKITRVHSLRVFQSAKEDPRISSKENPCITIVVFESFFSVKFVDNQEIKDKHYVRVDLKHKIYTTN